MSITALVTHALAEAHESEDWIHPLAAAVEGLTAAQAAWKPGTERHSIWQIVRHVIHWKRPIIDRWAGRPAPSGEELSASDWQEASGDDAAWQADVGTLLALHDELKQRVAEAGDDRLLRAVAGGSRPIALTLASVAVHDAYHAGQIRSLRALQGV